MSTCNLFHVTDSFVQTYQWTTRREVEGRACEESRVAEEVRIWIGTRIAVRTTNSSPTDPPTATTVIPKLRMRTRMELKLIFSLTARISGDGTPTPNASSRA